MILYEILVPTIRRDNAKPIRTRFHRVWDQKVRDIAGGLSIIQPIKGQWISSQGELFSERMIPVRIACDPIQIQKIAKMTLASLYQTLNPKIFILDLLFCIFVGPVALFLFCLMKYRNRI